MTYDLNTVSDVVGAFGGPAALAKRLGVTTNAVTNYGWRKQISGSHAVRVFAWLQQEGKSVNPAVFGYGEDWSEQVTEKMKADARRLHQSISSAS